MADEDSRRTAPYKGLKEGLMIKYGSVCSGIEAATVAWGSLGWESQWFCEIESFPKRVLKERFPNTPDLGDMTEIYDNPEFQNRTIDLLVGGTPCQSFSQAGHRLGLDDPRGNLALNFLKIARAKQPRWIVWENVPGVLSSGNGDDFATIIKTMVDCGYGVCWRMLDAQYFGLPQSRKRIFVVGHSSGDWRRAAAVLFERQTSSDNPARSLQTEGRIPVCTVRNAGNANARGVVVAESLTHAGESDDTGFEYEGKNLYLRRLTPAEEERRMGFSGMHTAIAGATDADRYKAIGNSMAVPVMRWVGEGIQAVDSLTQGDNMAKYTEQQKQAVAGEIKAGKSNKEIAANTGVQTSTISAVRRTLLLNKPTNGDSLEERARAVALKYPEEALYLVKNGKVGLILP
jgi:DNA (cytosine-5)-methyltransferase 1